VLEGGETELLLLGGKTPRAGGQGPVFGRQQRRTDWLRAAKDVEPRQGTALCPAAHFRGGVDLECEEGVQSIQARWRACGNAAPWQGTALRCRYQRRWGWGSGGGGGGVLLCTGTEKGCCCKKFSRERGRNTRGLNLAAVCCTTFWVVMMAHLAIWSPAHAPSASPSCTRNQSDTLTS